MTNMTNIEEEKDKFGRSEVSQEEATRLWDSQFWLSMTPRQIAEFQMMTIQLCMPFEVFHRAMEETLQRGIFTHEFGVGYQGLLDELFNDKAPPTLEEIINLIPAEKRLVVITD